MNSKTFKFLDYQRFFSLSRDLFCIAGTDGYFKHLNYAWEKLLGYSIEELKSRPYLEFVHPEDYDVTVDVGKDSNSGREVYHHQNRYRCKDGSYRWLQWAAFTIAEDQLIYAVARNITDQKQAEFDLRQAQVQLQDSFASENRARKFAEAESSNLRLVLAQIPAAAAIIMGPEHRYEFVNINHRKILGGRDPTGRTVKEMLPEAGSAIIDRLDRVYTTGERFKVFDAVIAADWDGSGKISNKVLDYVCEPIRDVDGKVTGIWVLAMDKTETKKMATQLRVTERMASLGTLAAGVAHEINNPLGYALTNISYILESSDLPPAIGRMLKYSVDGLTKIADIVRALKTFSRNDLASDNEIVDVQFAIQTAARFVENEVRHRAQLIFDFQSAPYIKCNQNKLIQVFLNLLVNAAQAMKVGSADENIIRVTTATSDRNELVVTVQDTGVGIPEENLERIFEPFYTTKAMGEGTGLGLSICHGIITSFGGSIRVESRLGKGSIFEVLLPGVLEKKLESAPVHHIDKGSNSEKLNILLIDDEERLLEAMSMVLSPHHTIHTAHSGKEALEQIRRHQDYDLIFCDLMMPEMTGMELFAEVTRWNNGFGHKFIFVTGGAFTAEGNEFLTKVKNMKLEKPFTAADLRKAIDNWKKRLGNEEDRIVN